ncbi:unnamed protein product, partial [Sphagnum compactum]
LSDTDRVSSPALSVNNQEDGKQTKSPQKKVIAAEQKYDRIEDGQEAVEPPSEQPVQGTAIPGEDYSIFTVGQKKLMIMTASLASLFSPMATAIYYPSLDTISKDLNVTNSKINITVTIFLVIQGIAPSFVADIADKQGRRPM